MNWKKFKKEIKVEDYNPDTSLGTFGIKIGCTHGKIYIDFLDDNGRTGLRIADVRDNQLSKYSKGLIIEWAKKNNAFNNSKPTENNEKLEKLIQKAKSKVSAIQSLEV